MDFVLSGRPGLDLTSASVKHRSSFIDIHALIADRNLPSNNVEIVLAINNILTTRMIDSTSTLSGHKVITLMRYLYFTKENHDRICFFVRALTLRSLEQFGVRISPKIRLTLEEYVWVSYSYRIIIF